MYVIMSRYISRLYSKMLVTLIQAQAILSLVLFIAFMFKAILDHPSPAQIDVKHLASEAAAFTYNAWTHTGQSILSYASSMRYSCIEGCSSSE